MVEMELKRDRIVIRLGTKKWEWTLEPRYWRNTLLWAAFLMIAPAVAYFVSPGLINTMISANIYAAIAMPLALMTIGTFLGAVWANESWGRYWGWDPKETWALITVVIYSVVTHLHLVKRWYSDWLFNLLSVLAFASVLMTFFGVNYFLSGMHSYGQTDASSSVFVYIAAAFFAIGLLGVVSYKKGIRYLVHGS
ncbi:MAG: Cytochrome c-type biogenesis protein CcsB [Proteiniphilum sp. 51_7]|nr:MAG: Cytochrome c-type biogenesis protein CcsB [Proteiniphilum sp. 51_7]